LLLSQHVHIYRTAGGGYWFPISEDKRHFTEYQWI
jgi:hypothetical protein